MDLLELEEKIKLNKVRLQRLRREDIISKARDRSNVSRDKRRKRNHDLIMRGALFETVGLIKETPEALLGFLMDNLELYEVNKEKYFKIGFTELDARKRTSVKMVGDKEIKELLDIMLILKDKDIDIVTVMQEKFKKKLLEQLSYDEFLVLKELKNKIKNF